jgi:hypothetical protein
MSAKHTPGRWYHVGGDDKRLAPYIRAVGDELPGTSAIAVMCHRGSFAESAANARLIAVAPELLVELKAALSDLEECAVELQAGPMSAMRINMNRIRVVIAKAEAA